MRIFIIILILISGINLHGQNSYTVIYEVKRQNPSSFEFISLRKFTLLISDSISYEYSYKKGVTPGKSFSMHSTFKNIRTKEILSQSQPYQRTRYLISDTLPEINWRIEKESQLILNHNCIKATCKLNNINYIAWFAPDITEPFGPGILYGLPGLILQLTDSMYDLTTTAISLSNTVQNFVRPHVGKKISSVEFKRIVEHLRLSE